MSCLHRTFPSKPLKKKKESKIKKPITAWLNVSVSSDSTLRGPLSRAVPCLPLCREGTARVVVLRGGWSLCSGVAVWLQSSQCVYCCG